VFTATFVIGSVVPFLLYSWLWHKARKLRKSVKHKLGHHIVQTTNAVLMPQPGKVGNQTKDKREQRATATFILLFVTVVITGTPSYLLQIVRTINADFHCKIPIYIHFIIIEVFLCGPMLTPLVVMRDCAFRESARKLFCCGKKTGDLEMQVGPSKSPSEPKSFSSSRRSSIGIEAPNFFNSNRRPSILEIPHTVHEIDSSNRPSHEKNITETKPIASIISESSESSSEC
jgi:hypothetical protein